MELLVMCSWFLMENLSKVIFCILMCKVQGGRLAPTEGAGLELTPLLLEWVTREDWRRPTGRRNRMSQKDGRPLQVQCNHPPSVILLTLAQKPVKQ